jgi:hypothetical protein
MDVELGAVEIVEEADRATEAAVAVERLRSLEFGEAYTAERIMKQTTDFYVPNVLRRLPGVSLLIPFLVRRILNFVPLSPPKAK